VGLNEIKLANLTIQIKLVVRQSKFIGYLIKFITLNQSS
jgi:hypothetical protein